jgi:hypothetical protein
VRFDVKCVVTRLAVAVALACIAFDVPAEFGVKGGEAPSGSDAILSVLRQDPYEMELLISFGTSKGGSAGHLALALRNHASEDDVVYSANFYADRSPGHEKGFYTDDLMVAIPKTEYLFGTSSSLGDRTSFGLDFGEIYKRSVIGIRVHGIPASEQAAVAAFFRRINDDYHSRRTGTEYHRGEIRYDYLHLNCAKTIGSAFKYGAGYKDLEVTSSRRSSARKVAAAANANIPTEMALKLMEAWHARGYRMDVVLYRKYEGSPYVDPHDEDKVAFKDLPDRFPSVLSRDFRRDQGEYRDADNLFAMYLLYNLGRYRVRIDDETKRLEIEAFRTPARYPDAVELARQNAQSDSAKFRVRAPFRPSGSTLAGNAGAPDRGEPASPGRKDAAVAAPSGGAAAVK